MLVLPAYYDGKSVKTIDDYKFLKNQKLMITVLDEEDKQQTVLNQKKRPIDSFFELADSLQLNSKGQKWTRESLHER